MKTNEIGILFFHGYCGGPFEVEPLIKHIKNIYPNVYIRTFYHFGHSSYEKLVNVQYEQWIKLAEAEYETMTMSFEKVIVVGYSMGGVIAGHIASKYDVYRLILLSAAFNYINYKLIWDESSSKLFDKINIFFRKFKKKVTEKQENNLPGIGWIKSKAKATGVSSTREFQKLVAYVRPNIGTIHCPTLVVDAGNDFLVPPSSAEYIISEIDSKFIEYLNLPNSAHNVCHTKDKVDRKTLFDKVIEFIDL